MNQALFVILLKGENLFLQLVQYDYYVITLILSDAVDANLFRIPKRNKLKELCG